MSRLILAAMKELTEEMRDGLRRKADSLGFEIRFFDRPEDALPLAREAEIVFAQSARLMKAAPHLRWICTPFAGMDGFLSEAGEIPEGVILTSSSGAYGLTIAEHTVMVILALMRRLPEYQRAMEKKEWFRGLPIRSIYGSRITILGTGDIGSSCAKRLRGFEPAGITGVSRSGREKEAFDSVIGTDGLDGLLPETDVLIAALPGTKETYHLLDKRRLEMLPQDAIIVNVGRGSALDQQALEELLRAGRLGGAALDVFETEPVPEDSTLRSCPRLLMTPHISGNTALGQTVKLIADQFAENLERYAAGQPMKAVVDPHRGY